MPGASRSTRRCSPTCSAACVTRARAPGSAPGCWTGPASVGVTSHNVRRTTASALADAGLSARIIADRLGHARPSMTQDVYVVRRAVNARVPNALVRRSTSERPGPIGQQGEGPGDGVSGAFVPFHTRVRRQGLEPRTQ
ncbi:tyrosine-type recombinase/integrase [Intrasporangium oryzae]|uniref:tyrosine-type recombinase/integrase n=1 Tax=Intrasporangium oryzae TaxID=412687 RepID=UPI000A0781D4